MLTVTSLLACILAFDEVSLIQTNGSSADAPYFVTQYTPAPTGTIVAGPKRSFAKFFSGSGSKPVRFVAAADIDGDDMDEYVVIREKAATGAAIVTVHSQPTTFGSKQPKPATSFVASGSPKLTGDGAITDVGSIAFDATPGDELVFLRDYADGRQEVEILGAPTEKKQSLGASLARVVVAVPGGERVRAAFGVGTQAGIGALILVHQDAADGLRFAAYAKPPAGSSALASPLGVAPIPVGIGETWIDAAEGARSAFDTSWILLTTRTAAGTTRVDRVRIDGTFGVLEATQTFGFVNSEVRHVLGVRRPGDPAPPPVAVEIPINCQYAVGYGGPGDDSYAITGAFGGFGFAKLQTNGDYGIGLPDGSTIVLKPTSTPGKFTVQPAVFGWQYQHPQTGQSLQAQYDLTGAILTSSGTPQKPGFKYFVFPSSPPIGTLTGPGYTIQLCGIGFGQCW